LNKVEYN